MQMLANRCCAAMQWFNWLTCWLHCHSIEIYMLLQAMSVNFTSNAMNNSIVPLNACLGQLVAIYGSVIQTHTWIAVSIQFQIAITNSAGRQCIGDFSTPWCLRIIYKCFNFTLFLFISFVYLFVCLSVGPFRLQAHTTHRSRTSCKGT